MRRHRAYRHVAAAAAFAANSNAARARATAGFALLLLLAAHTVYIYVLDGGKASKLQIPVLQLWGAIAASV